MQIKDEPVMPAIRPPGWTEHAKCRAAGSDLDHIFFPARHTEQRSEQAEQFCTGCPVRNLCAGLGEETQSSNSFWGGRWRK